MVRITASEVRVTQSSSSRGAFEASGDIQHLANTLWKSADALRGQLDAAEYKHVVLGLLFLKYIADSFESRRDDLRAELAKDGIAGE